VSALIAAIVLLVLGIATAELGARWWIRHRTRHHVWEPGLRWELHQVPELFPQVEPVVRFEINADGERGGPVRRDEPGLFRCLVAGGSAAECLALDQKTCWTGALEGLLSRPENLGILGARRAHVGSIGRGGISSRHLDVIFEHLLPEYPRLDLILTNVAANDVVLWLEDGAPAVGPAPVGVADVFPIHPERSFGWNPRRWALRDLARRARRAWLRPVEIRENAGAWVPPARRMRAQAKEVRATVPTPDAMLDAFEHHFRRLLRRAAAHARRVIVVRQPWFEKDYNAEEAARLWHGGLGKAWKQQISVYYAQSVLNRLMRLVDDRAARVADELGIEHIDLHQVLAPTLENYYDFVHYTPVGAARVASAVADVILRRPAPPQPSLVTSTTDQQW